MRRVSYQTNFWQRFPAHRTPPAPERKTHIALANMLRVSAKPYWFWSHIPSGEYRTERTGALLFRMGLKPGMCDFLLISPTGVHHWLELKRGNAPLSDAQSSFATMLRERGVQCYIARGFRDAETKLREWGAIA